MKPSRAAGGRLFKAFRTLRWKLTFSASAAMVAAIAVLTLVLVVQSSVLDQRLVESSPLEPVLQRETERLADDLEARLAREGALTASAAESWLQDHQSLAERGLTAPVVSPEGMARPAIFEVARLSVFDASGRLLGDLPGAQCAVNDPLPAGVVARVASLLEPSGAPLPARVAGAPIATAVAVYGGDERLVGAVALVASPQPLRLAAVAERASRILPGVLTDGAPAALLVALLIGVLSTRGLIRRLQRLRDASQAWATGDLSRRVADPSADELGEVSRSLDDMAQKVSTLLDARERLAAMEERTRIARELHDTVKQKVFSVSMLLGTVEAVLDHDRDRALEHLADARAAAQEAGQELRDLVDQLRPDREQAARLEGLDLARALRDHLEVWSRSEGIGVSLKAPSTDDLERVPAEVRLNFLRVAQEALANVAAHSGAGRAWVDLVLAGEHMSLSIRDDGAGFALGEGAKGGFGLESMRSRLERCAGSLRVSSRPGEGTLLVAECPVKVGPRPPHAHPSSLNLERSRDDSAVPAPAVP